MKKIVTLSALALAGLSAQAQITIQQSDYASWTPGVDSFSDVSQFTAMPAVNASYDLTTAVYDPHFTRTRSAATNTSFPQATYLEHIFYSFSSLSYLSDAYLGNTAQGIQRMGEVIERQAFSLGNITMNNQDSLVFIDQDIVYSSPRTMLKFPATYGTTWSSDLTFELDFELTVAMYMLNQTPGTRKSHVTQTDTVTGWGKMKVNNIDGDATGFMDVLAVKTYASVEDSFFLGGSPAPPQLLTAFGLSQGQVNNYYRTSYYRAGETDPLLYIQYDDATFTTVDEAIVHMSKLPAPTSISKLANKNNLSVYPNPVTDGSIHIALTKNVPANYKYELVNSLGQKVTGDALQTGNGTTTIKTTNHTPGIYYLNIYENGQPFSTVTLVIQPQ